MISYHFSLDPGITVFVYPEHQAVRLEKIISGGQTGADRAALDVGIERGLQAGGWIPKGRLAEDGPISTQYAGLVEADSSDPTVRTVRNVRDSDATLIVSHGPLNGGSLVTFEAAGRCRKPVLHLDLEQLRPTQPLRGFSSGWRRSIPLSSMWLDRAPARTARSSPPWPRFSARCCPPNEAFSIRTRKTAPPVIGSGLT